MADGTAYGHRTRSSRTRCRCCCSLTSAACCRSARICCITLVLIRDCRHFSAAWRCAAASRSSSVSVLGAPRFLAGPHGRARTRSARTRLRSRSCSLSARRLTLVSSSGFGALVIALRTTDSVSDASAHSGRCCSLTRTSAGAMRAPSALMAATAATSSSGTPLMMMIVRARKRGRGEHESGVAELFPLALIY